MQTPAALAMEWIVIVFIGVLGLIVLYKILVGKIDLSTMLNEISPTPGPGAGPPGPAPQAKASLSRLQMLLFTFVIAGLYLTLCLEAGQLIDIPNQVLGLLGISSGSYVVSKGIQMNA